MKRILSNGPDKDFVITAVQRLAARSRALHLAAPYFDYADAIVDAAQNGKTVQLLIGLNSATRPDAIAKVLGLTGVAARYYTDRFHAKIYVFDEAALLGSANLTNAGLHANREAVIVLDQDEDRQSIEDVRALFAELWETAPVLTPDIAKIFATEWERARKPAYDPDSAIADAVGKATPANINVASRTTSREQSFIQTLRRRIYEEYKPAFDEVSQILTDENLRRDDLAMLDVAQETNRFLNWVRLTKASGDEAWRSAPLRDPPERRSEILTLGREWRSTNEPLVTQDYVRRLETLREFFSDGRTLQALDKVQVTDALMSLHAFSEQLRFVKGGTSALGPAFWKENSDDHARVIGALNHLLFGPGDFAQRLHDLLYNRRWKLNLFGMFCALELFGSVHPEAYPPMNGRMAKALRFIGFDVRGA